MTLTNEDIKRLEEIKTTRANNTPDPGFESDRQYEHEPRWRARAHRAILQLRDPFRARQVAAVMGVGGSDHNVGMLLHSLEQEGLVERGEYRNDAHLWHTAKCAYPTSLQRRYPPTHPVREAVQQWVSRHGGDEWVRARDIAQAVGADAVAVGSALSAMAEDPVAHGPVTVSEADRLHTNRYRLVAR